MQSFFILILILPIFCFAQLTGKVVYIDDGDTFVLLDSKKQQIKIRLYGIDAPEHGQAFGEKAKQYLSSLIFQKNVQVITKSLDQYGRTIGITISADSNINEIMIKHGYAWHYVQYDQNPVWDRDEREARKSKEGLWADSSAIAPWNWRHNKPNQISRINY